MGADDTTARMTADQLLAKSSLHSKVAFSYIAMRDDVEGVPTKVASTHWNEG